MLCKQETHGDPRACLKLGNAVRYKIVQAVLGNLSTKTGAETGFSPQNLDRLLNRVFSG